MPRLKRGMTSSEIGSDKRGHYAETGVEIVMVLTKTGICGFGWKARDFALQGVDGKTYRLADVRGRTPWDSGRFWTVSTRARGGGHV
jgi:hypothetical protein